MSLASLSDLPEPERNRVVRIGYWTWLVLLLGAAAAVMYVRGIAAAVTAPLAAVLVLLFVALEIYQPILVRRLARDLQKEK
jgi:hypothetical protein